MKKLILCLMFLGIIPSAFAEFALPPEVALAVSKSSSGESGGLFVNGMEEKRFLEYICAHWKEIADNIEQLPGAAPDWGSPVSQEAAFNASVDTFATACEWLPPEEYMDFLDKLSSLYEDKRIGYLALGFQLSGNAKKDSFLAVNWHHPRVQAFFNRLRPLLGEGEKDGISMIDMMSRGELADSYMTNKSVDAPYPETLPGVKLERPFGSLIKQYEKLTGKKVPPDPDFPAEDSARPEKRPGHGDSGKVEEVVELTLLGKSLLGGILVLVAAGIAWGVARWRRKRGGHLSAGA